VPPTSQHAVIALVLAVLAWLVCPVVLAVVALVLAGAARREIIGSGGRIGGEGIVTAARVLAWLNIAVVVLIVGAVVLVMIIGMVASTSVTSVPGVSPSALGA
jgi:hypothetical protein